MSATANAVLPAVKRAGNGRELVRQASHYVSGSGLAVLSSMISYPLLTRMLSQADYGLMSLVSVSLTVLVAISKLGLSNAAVRFYPDYTSPDARRIFLSTLFWVPVLNGTFLAALACGIILLIFGASNLAVTRLILLALPITVLEAAKAVLLSFMRAAQCSRQYSVFSTLDRYGHMVIGLTLVVLLGRNLAGWYIGWLLWDAALTGYLMAKGFRAGLLGFSWFHPAILKTVVSFGAPLILAEIGALALTYADRYMIAKYIGVSAAGVYSAAYNLTLTVQSLLVVPLTSAVFPWASQIWKNGTEDETRRFLGKVFDYFMVAGVPIVVGICVLRVSLMAVFASMKYNDAAPLLPPLIASQLAYGVYNILIVGLFLRKRTITMALQLLLVTAVNVAANIVLIPRLGMMGAAWAMCISNTVLILLALKTSIPQLRIQPTWPLLAKIAACSAVMGWVITALPISADFPRLMVGTIVGAVVYGTLLLLSDRKLWRTLKGFLSPPLSAKL